MPNRPFTDITSCISENPVKNGSAVVSTTFTGQYNTLDTYVKNIPTIETIHNKYGNRFYNGVFVQLTSDQTIIGG
jgi:hypothetical protein